MKKVVSVLIVLALACNVFSVVSFAEIDFSGGLLDGKPFDGGFYEFTDNDINTGREIIRTGNYTFTFPNNVVANISGFRLYRTGAPLELHRNILLRFYDKDGKLLYSYAVYTTTHTNGTFISLNVSNVKKINIYNNTGFMSAGTVWEFNVYGTLSLPLPTQVKNVHVKDTTPTSALISWDPNPEEVQKYIIYLDGQIYGETTGTEYTISDLQPNTTYEVTVTAINEAGEGPASEPLIFTTPELPPEPATKVKNVVIKNMTSTSATISWMPNPETERITKYVIYLNGEKYGETEGTEYVIEGLKEGEKYIITVAAVNELGEGPPSSPITFTTSKIIDISTTIKVQDILSSIAVLFTNLWPLLAFALALIAIVPITRILKQILIRRRSNA